MPWGGIPRTSTATTGRRWQPRSKSALEDDRPSLISCHTHIAHGAPHAQDTAGAHGSPLGEEEIKLTKEAMGFPIEPPFHVEDGVYEFFSAAMNRGRDAHRAWTDRFESATTEQRSLWSALHDPTPVKLDGPGFEVGGSLATRASSSMLFGEMAEKVPGFIGGAADLAGSTKTVIEKGRLFSRDDRSARDIPFGIREHAMGAAVNGMAVHGGLKPYSATFFVFSDYQRPAVRLSAIMRAPSIWVYTHDSIFLGEDGPTHQPIEHLASLRAMPNLWVIRPADANETLQAWEIALNRHDGPVALVLTRQNLPTLDAGPGWGEPGRVRRPGGLGGDHDRHRLGGLRRPRRCRSTGRGRHRGPRCESPLLGALLRAGQGLSGRGARHRTAGVDRGGSHFRVGTGSRRAMV